MENVEIMRAVFEAWNVGDMDGVRELCDSEVIMRNPEGWPEPGPFVGREAVIRQLEQVREIWDTDVLEPIGDFIEVADRAVVRYTWRGAGRGPESNMELTALYTVRKGKVLFVEFFWDHAEALEAMGLSEQDVHADRLASVPDGSRARPQEDVETVRRIYDAWSKGDFRARVDDLDPHVVLVVRPDFPEFGVFVGPDGVSKYMRRFLEQWERLTIEAKQIHAIGDTVLAPVVQHGKGRTSGIEGDFHYFMVFTFRGGKVVRIEAIREAGEAHEAVGLLQHPHPNS